MVGTGEGSVPTVRGVLQIINREGEHVATLEWDGTMWKGKGEWIWYRDKEIRTKITNAIKSNEDLRLTYFSDLVRDSGQILGFHGFSGWLQALTLALPAFGLKPDTDNVIWPFVQDAEILEGEEVQVG